jgi:hypothetical protein
MAYAALGYLEMVHYRPDWAKRTATEVYMGPYTMAALETMEYDENYTCIIY